MSIVINVVNQKMNVSSSMDGIVAGSQQFVKFRFNLREEWDGLMTFAQFIQNGVAYNQYLDEENSAYLPPEIIAGTCHLMLYGSNKTTIGTTNCLTFKISENMLISDASSTEISESLYTQLVTKVNNIASWDVKSYEQFLSEVQQSQLAQAAMHSQGRSAKYAFTSPGWKRVLNIIRATNGTLQLGVAKATGGIYAVQALGINFTGNVNFPSVGIDTEPVIYQVYDHEFGDNNSEEEKRHARITQVRIGYPASNTEYPESDGSVNYKTNPVNCYVDVYVDFNADSGNAQLNMNFAGFADSHNCTPIVEEMDVTETDTGIYGETLQYKYFTVSRAATMYMPDGTIKAKEVHADNIKELEDTATANRNNIGELSALVATDGERIAGLIADALHPEIKTDDMTQPVGVDENGALWTQSGDEIGKPGTGTGAEIFNYYTSNKASGAYSHAEGNSTKSSGHNSHAEGFATTSSGQSSHAEGQQTQASGGYSHAEGYNTIASSISSHAEGYETIASGGYSHAEGQYTEASVNNAHAEGYNTTASGGSAHAEGCNTEAYGAKAHAEGFQTTASGANSHAEGSSNVASGEDSHVEGKNNVASGYRSHAEGFCTAAKGNNSHSEGYKTIANGTSQHVQGRWNVVDTGANGGDYAHIVGNGKEESDRSNIHTVSWKGVGYFLEGTSTTGADYAEFFEWQDGNPNADDRVGLVVTLEGEKIRFAQSGDNILGIISGTTAVLGDSAESEWKHKYLTDAFGRTYWDMVEEFEEVVDEETGEVTRISLGFFPQRRLNPDYDPSEEYIPRKNRKEWDKVGLMGKIYTRDDGTCTAGGYGAPGIDGVLTHSDIPTNIQIMKRTGDNIVLVLLK